MLRILIYTGIMGISIYLGQRGFLKDKLKGKIEKIQLASLIILLFIMGIGLGKKKDIISSFSVIGLKSVIISLSAIVFSVLSLYLYNKVCDMIFKRKKDKSAGI